MSLETWKITQHACRECFGRILSSAGRVCCAVCEVEAVGTPEALCGCGIHGVDAVARPLRCGPNPARGPGNPAAVAILLDVVEVA